MDFDDRVAWMALGCAIGFVLGYIVRMLKDIKEEVDEIDEIVKRREKDERGEVRIPSKADIKALVARIPIPSLPAIALFVVVCLSFWASITTQITSNELQDKQAQDDKQDERLEKITQCTLEFTSKTISALNERTTYTVDVANANVAVLKKQQDFLNVVLIVPPVSDEQGRAALEAYVASLEEFVQVTDKSTSKIQQNPYPTNEELSNCLGVPILEVESGEEEVE